MNTIARRDCAPSSTLVPSRVDGGTCPMRCRPASDAGSHASTLPSPSVLDTVGGVLSVVGISAALLSDNANGANAAEVLGTGAPPSLPAHRIVPATCHRATNRNAAAGLRPTAATDVAVHRGCSTCRWRQERMMSRMRSATAQSPLARAEFSPLSVERCTDTPFAPEGAPRAVCHELRGCLYGSLHPPLPPRPLKQRHKYHVVPVSRPAQGRTVSPKRNRADELGAVCMTRGN